MNKEISRFFLKSDDFTEKFVFKLPKWWPSRPYEYSWAIKFADKNDVVLDAACGVNHPFKFKLIEICAEVHACDIDQRILKYDEMKKCNRRGLWKKAGDIYKK